MKTYIRHFYVKDRRGDGEFYNIGDEQIFIRKNVNECTIVIEKHETDDSDDNCINVGYAKLGKREKAFSRKRGLAIASGRAVKGILIDEIPEEIKILVNKVLAHETTPTVQEA